MRRATIATLFLILVFAPGALFAQEDEWYIGKPIKDFTFSGLATVSVNDLQPIVKPYIDKVFTMDLFWDVQSKLFALDWFESIEGEAKSADDAKSAVIVDFVVKERPSVSKIDLVGNRDVWSSDILDKILVKKGDLVSQAKVKADESAIRNLYLEKGYTDVAVTGRITTDEKENTAVVTFEISEGAQTTIKEVRFSGNSFASESTLRNLMKTKPPFLFDPGVFQESKLEEDKRAIIDYYTSHGYVDAKIERVDKEVQSQEGKNYLILTVYLTEGEQWTYKGLSFEGNQVFTTARLEELVFQKPDTILNLKKLKDDNQRVVDLYYENGYVFNAFNLKENRDEKERTISFTLAIVERDKAHIESIIFKGNKKTKESVLRRGLPFEEGDIFDKAKVYEGWRYLYNLQYFSSIQPETPTGSAEGLLNIVFNLEEQNTTDIKFGLEFTGQSFPVVGSVTWNDSNFLGNGQNFGIQAKLSLIEQSISFSFLEPWLLGRRLSLGLNLSFKHAQAQNVPQDILPPIFGDDQTDISAPDPFSSLTDWDAWLAKGNSLPPVQYLMTYELLDTGLGVTSGYSWQLPFGLFGIRGGLSTDLRYVTYDPTVNRPWDATVRNNLNTLNIIDQLTATVYLDGRDYYLNPTNGYRISQGITYTGGFLFGSRQYNRTDSLLEGFLTLFSLPVSEDWSLKLVVAAHSALSILLPQYAYMTPAGGTAPVWGVTAPVVDTTDMLYVDGMNVARGWPLSYGEALWDNRLELRMPIAEQYIWAVGYIDMVGLWSKPDNLLSMSIDQFYFSVGFGIRVTIPQFPIRVYLSKKFQVQNGAITWKTSTYGDPLGLNFDIVISLGGDVF